MKKADTTTQTALVRSSAAEYLTFIAATGQGGVEAVYADENVWLTQKMMAQLYDVDVRTVNYHLKKVLPTAKATTPSTTTSRPSSPWATR